MRNRELLMEQIYMQVLRRPTHTALVFGKKQFSYRELWDLTDRLANVLMQRGIGRGKVVSVLVPRCEYMLICALGVLKTGAAYQPLDAAYPAGRIRYMVEDADSSLVIAAREYQGLLGDMDRETFLMEEISSLPPVKKSEEERLLCAREAISPEDLFVLLYTSGSSGKPKGCMLEHGNICSFCMWYQRYYEVDETCRMGEHASFVFDVSMMELFMPLVSGAAVYIIPEEIRTDLVALNAFFEENGITHCSMTTQLGRQFVLHTSNHSLRHLTVAGEALAPIAPPEGYQLHNGYGPTEGTILLTIHRVSEADDKTVPIGRPLDEVEIYVLNAQGERVSQGEAGELCAAGPHITRGYLHQPAQTAKVYTENPFDDREGYERIYHTGDIVCYRSDGLLEYLGRADEQVKIRGFRIEPAEVESILRRCRGIFDATVAVTEHKEEKYLTAYYVSDEEMDEEEMRETMLEKCPYYMVPSFFIRLDEIPLNINGKVDKKRLPQPEWKRESIGYQAPQNDMERMIAESYAELLDVEQVGREDDFLRLGGHSLLAVKLLFLLRERSGRDVSIQQILAYPVVRELAERLENTEKINFAAEKFPFPGNRKDYAAGSAQKRIYAAQQLCGENDYSYHLPLEMICEGTIDAERVKEALACLFERHEILRTALVAVDGVLRQKILPDLDEPPYCDMTEQEAVKQWVYQALEHSYVTGDRILCPFDMEHAPLFHWNIREENGKTRIFMDWHHCISDGGSMELFVQEFCMAYQKKKLPELPIQYKEFTAWEETADFSVHRKAWNEMLAGELPTLELRTDKVRPAKKRHLGKTLHSVLTKEISDELAAFCREHSVTEYIFLYTVWFVLLHKYTGQERVVTGTVMAGRERQECEKMQGMFVNTVPVMAEITGKMRFLELLAQVKEHILFAQEYQIWPLENIAEDLKADRTLSGNLLFDVLFVMQRLEREQMLSDDRKVEVRYLETGSAMYDLTLETEWIEGQYHLRLEYDLDLFEESSVRWMLRHYQTLLAECIAKEGARLEELDMISEEERSLLTEKFQGEKKALPNHTVVDALRSHAGQNPEKQAVVFGGDTLNYRELNHLSDILSERILCATGGKTGQMGMVFAQRSLEMIVSIFGILKAGMAYVPVSPEYPEQRIRFLLEDSMPSVILVCGAVLAETHLEWANQHGITVLGVKREGNDGIRCSRLAGGRDADGGKMFSPSAPDQTQLAYMIYTSGTTGAPKGVMVEHRQLINLLEAYTDIYQLTARDCVLQFADFVFDQSVWDIFHILYLGGTLCLIPPAIVREPEQLEEYCRQKGVTVASLTPGFLWELHPEKLPRLRLLDVGGEAPTEALLRRWLPGRMVFNTYGPTETTVNATSFLYQGKAGTVVPIGKAIPNTQVYIMHGMELCGIGIPGELCIAGAGVTRGYLHREDLTAEKYIKNPFGGGKMYRSGDVARYLPDGNIEFLGRRDNQVKVRGFRMELDEIEHRMSEVEQVRDAAVIVKESSDGDKRLCGYYTADCSLEPAELKRMLEEMLPYYMVPQALVHLEEMPLTVNGKIDRKNLPVPEFGGMEEYVPPETEAQEVCVQVWEEILKISRIGVEDDFFELGGDSIKAIRMVSHLRERGYETEVRYLLQARTIRRLEGYLSKAAKSQEYREREEVRLTPILWDFFRTDFPCPNHYNQSVMLSFQEPASLDAVKKAVNALAAHHAMLRAYTEGKVASGDEKGSGASDLPASHFLRIRPREEMPEIDVEESPFSVERCEECQASLCMEDGIVLRAHLFHWKEGKDRLLFVIHHIAVDEVSWGILLEDFSALYRAAAEGKTLENCLPAHTISFGEWSERQEKYRNSLMFQTEENYWRGIVRQIETLPLTEDRFLSDRSNRGFTTDRIRLEQGASDRLRQMAQHIYHCRLDAVLLAALCRCLKNRFMIERCPVYMESHGRGVLQETLRTDRTVGWFTAIYPMILTYCEDREEQIISCKETLLCVPNEGIGYGLYRQKNGKRLIPGGIVFNYHGEEQTVPLRGMRVCSETFGTEIHPDNGDANTISFNIRLLQDGLEILCTYDNRMDCRRVAYLLDGFVEELRLFAEEGRETEQGEQAVLTPSDVSEPGTIPIEDWNVLRNQFRPEDCERIFTLTPLQEGMLYHWMAQPDGTSYVLQDLLTVHGKWDASCMERALQILAMRYEALRTSFYQWGLTQAYQVIWKERNIYFEVIEKGQPEAYRQRECERHFSLSDDSLIRILAFPNQAQKEEVQLLVTQHHIILDGWSFPVLLQTLERYYLLLCEGKSMDEMRELVRKECGQSCAYSSYLAWRQRQGHNQEESLTYWKSYLGECTEGGSVQPTASGGKGHGERMQKVSLAPQFTKQLRALMAQFGITMSTLFETVWGVLLQRENHINDVVFGKTVSGRNIELAGIEKAVGMFINTIPVRVTMSGEQSVRELLLQQQERAIASMPYEDTALSEIQSLTGLGDTLVQTLFVYENYYAEEQEDSCFETETLREETNYPVTFFVEEKEGLSFHLLYDGSMYCESQMARLAGRIERILHEMAEAPEKKAEELSVITAEEKADMLGDFSGKRKNYPEKSFLMMLREQAQTRADAIAIRFFGQELTYRQLYEAGQKAAAQIGCNGNEKRFVAIFAERRMEMIVSIVGAMLAGAAYVPIDPQYPKDRIRYILGDCKPEAVLLSVCPADREKMMGIAEELGIPVYDINLQAMEGMECAIPEEALFAGKETWENRAAYMIYTSGTTGHPKGVVITHGSLSNMIYANADFYGFCPEDVVLQLANYVFDQSVWDIFNTLGTGGTLCLIDRETMQSAEALEEYCGRQHVTVLMTTTVMLGALHPERFHGLRFVDCGGDVARREIMEKWYPVTDLLVNSYGPTEATVNAAAYVYRGRLEGSVPIGRPLPNKKIYILQGEKLCGIGMRGEICIAGEGLAGEYLNQPELTAKSFVRNPFGTGRMYRTGDLGRYMEDGNLLYDGRIDSQIKLRGFRIELTEIEHSLCEMPQIAEAAVVCFREDGQEILAAYLVSEHHEELEMENVRAELNRKLPYYMIPDSFVQIAAIPLNQSGKLDVSALERPARKENGQYEEPENDMEQKIAELFAEILNTSPVGRNDSFFALGGNSIDVMRLISALGGYQVTVNEIFACDTPKLLGEELLGKSVREMREAERPQVLWQGSRADSYPSLICLPPSGGMPFCYLEWLKKLEWQGTAYGMHDMKYRLISGLSEEERSRMEKEPSAKWAETIDAYWREMQNIWKDGDILVGYSQGGSVAHQLARRLEKNGKHPGAIIMLEAEPHQDAGQEADRRQAYQIAGLEKKQREKWTPAEETAYLVAWQNIADPLPCDGIVECPIYACNLSGRTEAESSGGGVVKAASDCWKPYTSGDSGVWLIQGSEREHLIYLQKYKNELAGWVKRRFQN